MDSKAQRVMGGRMYSVEEEGGGVGGMRGTRWRVIGRCGGWG